MKDAVSDDGIAHRLEFISRAPKLAVMMGRSIRYLEYAEGDMEYAEGQAEYTKEVVFLLAAKGRGYDGPWYDAETFDSALRYAGLAHAIVFSLGLYRRTFPGDADLCAVLETPPEERLNIDVSCDTERSARTLVITGDSPLDFFYAPTDHDRKPGLMTEGLVEAVRHALNEDEETLYQTDLGLAAMWEVMVAGRREGRLTGASPAGVCYEARVSALSLGKSGGRLHLELEPARSILSRMDAMRMLVPRMNWEKLGGPPPYT